MQLLRIEVDGGFLDGLDIELVPGLNVIIGARGTGKTSIIELIRYCLAIPGLSTESLDRGNQQAVSVLGDGIVTVTVDSDIGPRRISRGASEKLQIDSVVEHPPTVLAQSEVETVGSQASGRLALIDRMIPAASHVDISLRRTGSALKSQTAEIQGLVKQLTALEEQLAALSSVPDDLKEASNRQQIVLADVEANRDDRVRLAELQAEMASIAVRGSVLDQAKQDVEKIITRLGLTESAGRSIVSWPNDAGQEDLLAGVRHTVGEALDGVVSAARAVEGALLEVRRLEAENQSSRSETDRRARELRLVFERLQQGLGETSKTVDRLQELDGQRLAIVSRLNELKARIASIVDERRSNYRELEGLRNDRFNARSDVCARLTDELQPRISVKVYRSAKTDAYSSAIAAALRGSGLHYNTWAPRIASSMPPIELVEAVEAGDASAIALAAELPIDTADALIDRLREASLASLISVPVDDGVSLSLLDGMTPKTTENLSIGQRCTVVLPVLLSPPGQTLIIDQPEDHLDNAFISDTLVETLRRRTPADQLVFSSHNANIPVLGEADRVIVLDSDGKRGFVLHQNELDAPQIVAAILSLLEGGDLAFKKRASFYERVSERPDGEV